MTTTTAPAIDYTTIVRTWTDEMVANSRTAQAPRDGKGNMIELTDAQRAFTKAINAEWRRRFDRAA
jgi:fructose-1-phosphate kinase PfkB-like protein